MQTLEAFKLKENEKVSVKASVICRLVQVGRQKDSVPKKTELRDGALSVVRAYFPFY